MALRTVAKRTPLELPPVAWVLLAAAIHRHAGNIAPRSMAAAYLNRRLYDEAGAAWVVSKVDRVVDGTRQIVLRVIREHPQGGVRVHEATLQAWREAMTHVRLVVDDEQGELP